ncbi:MAG: hypothetical protein K2I90_13210 [Odoribacter sp.]|nr:hypothetical protein [Odoribacter sp.]
MKNFFYLVLSVMFLVSCGGQKKMVTEVSRSKSTSLEGEKVVVENIKKQGYEVAESLNDEGTEIIQFPFKWYEGEANADNKQMAIELAQREAYVTISRVLQNVVEDQAKRGNLDNNGKVQQAVTSYWEQMSMSIQRGCEPFGNVTIQYSPATRMYNVRAKVAIRGDRFQQMLNNAGNFRPDNLSGEELEQFIEVNKAIMEAAKGN